MPKYVSITLILCSIVLAWVIFRECDRSPDHTQDVRQVQQDQKQLKQQDEQTQATIGRLTAHADSLQRQNVELQAQLDVYKKEVTASKEKTKRLTGELARAKADKDTLAFINTCDSLSQLVQDKDLTIAGYMALVDSVSANYQRQIDYKDSILNQQTELLMLLRDANRKLENKVYEINKDYNKTVKRLKRERTLGRVLAGGAAVLGGLILLK